MAEQVHLHTLIYRFLLTNGFKLAERRWKRSNSGRENQTLWWNQLMYNVFFNYISQSSPFLPFCQRNERPDPAWLKQRVLKPDHTILASWAKTKHAIQAKTSATRISQHKKKALKIVARVWPRRLKIPQVISYPNIGRPITQLLSHSPRVTNQSLKDK